jgi:hypothetical protein
VPLKKLRCIFGCIYYILYCAFGEIAPIINNVY